MEYRPNFTRGGNVLGEEENFAAPEAVSGQCRDADGGGLFHGPPTLQHEWRWRILRGSRGCLHKAGPYWGGKNNLNFNQSYLFVFVQRNKKKNDWKLGMSFKHTSGHGFYGVQKHGLFQCLSGMECSYLFLTVSCLSLVFDQSGGSTVSCHGYSPFCDSVLVCLYSSLIFLIWCCSIYFHLIVAF